MRIYSSIVCFIFLFLFTQSVQAQPAFYAMMEDEKVFLGSYFNIQFQLSEANGGQFKAPDLKRFKIVSGPSKSSSTTIINGKIDKTETYSYTLLAEREGNFVIEPASILVNGKVLKSNPLEFKILKPVKEDPLSSEGINNQLKYFIRAELSVDTAMIGQQVFLDYKLYTRETVDNVDFRTNPDLSEFYWKQINLFNGFNRAQTERVDINGTVYLTQVVRRLAIFPLHSGDYTFDPVHVTLLIADKGKRRSFFKSYRNEFAESQTVRLKVLSAPANLPESFAGVTGLYFLNAEVEKTSLTTDDAITIRMTLKGDGDPNRFTIPVFPFDDRLEAYEPKIIAENDDQQQKRLVHYKTIEYNFIPKEAGTYYIQPYAAILDPDSMNIIYLKNDSIRINVRQGKGTTSFVQEEKIMDEYIKMEVSGNDDRSFPVIPNSLMWLLFGLTSSTVFGIYAHRLYKEQQANIPVRLTRKEQFSLDIDLLKGNLNEAKAHQLEELLGDFFRGYFNIGESEWSLPILLQKFKEHNIDSAHIIQAEALFSKLSFAAYSGVQSEQSMQSWIKSGEEIIASLAD